MRSEGGALEDAELGLLISAVAASLISWAAFRPITRLPKIQPLTHPASTLEELVDLSEEVDPQRDRVRGARDAPVTLVEYGDYECPCGGQAEPILRELLLSFGQDRRYVLRHLPLSDVHRTPRSPPRRASGGQGAFWEMHAKLIGHQDQLTPA